MKNVLIAITWIRTALLATSCAASSQCKVAIRSSLSLPTEELLLSDLINESSCPELSQAAGTIRLGAAPLPGSVRVLDGVEIERRFRTLEKVVSHAVVLDVPERIMIRRGGARLSCSEIATRLSSELLTDDACGASDGIEANASLKIERKQWDTAARNWNLVVRCRRANDCVPFVVRLAKGSGSGPLLREPTVGASASAVYTDQTSPETRKSPVLVRRGERIKLIWDQERIRLLVPAIALEEGCPGQSVKVRTLPSGRLLHAIVEGAGILRAE